MLLLLNPASCVCCKSCPIHSSCDSVCRRYTLPLEEFYIYNGTGPNITAYMNGEPKAHKSYNCSIHCGGRQFCGAGNPGMPPITVAWGQSLSCHAESCEAA